MLKLLLIVSIYLVRINRIVPFIWLNTVLQSIVLRFTPSCVSGPDHWKFWFLTRFHERLQNVRKAKARPPAPFPSRGASLPGFQIHWGQSLPYWSQHPSSRTAAGPSPWVPVTPTPTLVCKVLPAVCSFCSLGCLIFLRFSFQVF